MKNALFIMLDEYADWEGAYLASTLNQLSDWQVATASLKSTVTSIGGFKTKVDYLIPEVPQNLSLLVLIGGNSWQVKSPELVQLIKQQLISQTPVAAICGAVDFLAQNGLLTGYRHTGNAQYLWQDFSNYTNANDFREVQAISDKNLVTANGTAALAFTKLVLEQLHFSPETIKQSVELHQLGFYAYTAKYGNPYLN
ncbi:glutamine amidotransferase [Lactobacillus sp. CC-MHH1034]|uniref:type 1 glutamine amidotransferase family protein n=1 Tax=Agrilactobacillus fermenti TaxID=2586909 RepID=UPI001E4B0B40|nr:type 1 glutamine amidotransferase family protein [Agrilactobacillus fermenti]MCD2255581.1 glutamine amidotransferase [Agrilactobacillus fermenti]